MLMYSDIRIRMEREKEIHLLLDLQIIKTSYDGQHDTKSMISK